jgi:hypothetical protein
MKLKSTDILRRNTAMLSSSMDNEMVMMSIDQGEYYGLNSIGARIWDLLENPLNISDLVKLLTQEFEVSEEDCLNDILPFLESMVEKKILFVE